MLWGLSGDKLLGLDIYGFSEFEVRELGVPYKIIK